jgi:phosphatidylinositol-3-phosphatase
MAELLSMSAKTVNAATAACLVLAAGCSSSKRQADACSHSGGGPLALPVRFPVQIGTVFVIVLENANWSDVRGNPSLPFLNRLVETSAHEEQYRNPPGVHPSEPNYLWLEGGTDYGIRDDGDPARHQLSNADHLVALLRKAGISWRTYQEGIGSRDCPVTSHGLYAAKHNPFVFFDDVTGDLEYCVAHMRPLVELADDLRGGTVARYNFITPDLCHDMHGAPVCRTRLLATGDQWLSTWVPRIQASQEYRSGGVLFITWDEAESGDGPIGMIALSPLARTGYAGTARLTHSALLRTIQEIFGVGPLLCDANSSADLADLFATPERK